METGGLDACNTLSIPPVLTEPGRPAPRVEPLNGAAKNSRLAAPVRLIFRNLTEISTVWHC